MKNKLLLIALIALTAIGCKKDEIGVLKMNDMLMGNWSVISNKITYYDPSGQIAYEEVLEDTSIADQVTFMKGLKASVKNRNAEVLDTRYNLIKENNVVFVELYDAAIFDANIWKIAAATATDMSWTAGFTEIKYENKETGEIVESAKAILTLNFKKQ